MADLAVVIITGSHLLLKKSLPLCGFLSQERLGYAEVTS